MDFEQDFDGFDQHLRLFLYWLNLRLGFREREYADLWEEV